MAKTFNVGALQLNLAARDAVVLLHNAIDTDGVNFLRLWEVLFWNNSIALLPGKPHLCVCVMTSFLTIGNLFTGLSSATLMGALSVFRKI